MEQQTQSNKLIIALGFSALLASVGTSMANLALPAISDYFGISFSDARLVVLSYLAASTLFSLIVGILGDRKGRQRILILGIAFFTFGTMISGFAPTFWILVLARVVQGVGAAALLVMPIAIVSESLPTNKVGKAYGLLATMSAIGTASGPSVGGFMVELFGWRSVFFFMSILGILNFVLNSIFAFSNSKKQIETPHSVTFETTIRAVISNSSLRSQLLANLVVSSVMMSTLIIGPFYLAQALKLDAFHMGLVMTAGPITSIVSGIFSGFAVDRFGAKAVVIFGFVQLMIGAVSFIEAPKLFGSFGFAFSAVLLSLGYQLFLSANSKSAMENVDSKNRGLVSGALTLSRNLGLIGGAFFLGGFFDFVSRPSKSTEANETFLTLGLQATFAVSAILILLSLINFLKTEQRRKNETRFPIQIY